MASLRYRPMYEEEMSNEDKLDYLHRCAVKIVHDHGQLLDLEPFPQGCGREAQQ